MRTVVVTGGGTGIGRAISEAFAESGEQVVILGRRKGILASAVEAVRPRAPGGVFWRQCDVSDPDQVDEFVEWLTSSVSSTIDVLVNNAGSTSLLPPDAGTRAAHHYAQQMLSANLVGAYLMIYRLRPHMRRPGGRIINLASIAAFRGGAGMYSAAKAGVVGLTYAMAGELGAEGVTVNAVAPGLVLDTELFGDRMTDELSGQAIAMVPVGRAGKPADIAAAVLYLASPGAEYVTGEVLHVNGGWIFGR